MNKENIPKILFVDDSKTVQAVVKSYLSDLPLELICAEDGFKALPLIINEQPSLIFLDVVMPKLDGYQLCSMIKTKQECAHIPIVILTSRDTVFDKAKGRISGCNGYLVKPINKDDLIKITNTFIKEA